MSRRTLASACLALSALMGGLVPGLVAPVAASSCSAWSSETAPPPTIRVYRHASGTVQTVNFKTYTKNVLSREWIGSWSGESLRSGALMVRNYAWYQVLHWRGGVDATGSCFDLRDDTWDQVYDPSQPTWSTAAAAVDSTWSATVHRDGHIFPTYYNAGAPNEACGTNANGWKAFQWGTQSCGLAGLNAAQIVLIYYYPGVTVTGVGAPGSSPSPTASPSPRPTATPTPAASPTSTPTPRPTATPTAKPTASGSSQPSPTAHPSPTSTPTAAATPAATPTARPTASPTAQPTPSPTPGLPSPPADQQLPGGGQASVANASEPPPPPPQHPRPMVATRVVVPDPITWSRGVGGTGGSGPLASEDPWAIPSAGLAALAPRTEGGEIASGANLDQLGRALALLPGDARLLTFRERFPVLAEAFLRALAREISGQGQLVALLRP